MYAEWARQMRAAKTNAERKAIVAEMCRMYAFSPAKAYAVLKKEGWESGRKRRADAGNTSMGEEELKSLANMLYKSLRKNGKATMPVDVARSILQSRGVNIPVGDSRLRELLRRYRLSVKDAKTSKPYQRMRSEFPNQIHQADPSFCLLYFAPGGKQRIVGDDEHYKNKDFYRGGKLKCLRYVLTDHFSSSICVRYYAAPGETALNMYDFLLYAWGKKDDPLYAFHGLPKTLVWDCGSGNLARSVTNALIAFRVTTIPHLPGNPRAKGQVENANNLVETQFESRLRFEPVQSVEELNAAAERWCAAYNANMIPNLDTRLTRNGLVSSRLMLWQKIRPEQLRELPDAETCRQIYSTKIETRKVAGDLSISMVHPNKKRSLRYSLSECIGILVGQEVNVQPVLIDPEPLVIVSYKHQGEVVSREVAPIAYDENGFDIDAPVYGKNYKREPDTQREKRVKELNALDSSGPAWSFINAASPFIRPRAGEQITVAQPDRIEIHDILISHFEAAKQVKARNGWLSDSFISRMKAAYPEGVPSSCIDDIAHDEAGQDAALSL
jgi:hypothetical protein